MDFDRAVSVLHDEKKIIHLAYQARSIMSLFERKRLFKITVVVKEAAVRSKVECCMGL
jgi:hypothetical protein